MLPAIAGRDEFVVADKGTYTVINYNVMMADTFPTVIQELLDAGHEQDDYARIRRECRGIIFDSKTGDIIRRPFFKFFNVNEREETQLHNLDFSKEHWVDIKLDGSMIAVFAHEGNLVWGTKMVAPDFHDMVEKFVESSDVDYAGFCWKSINDGYTPIFEWMHPQKRIVIDYGKEPALTLLAVRHMVTGTFADLDKTPARQYGVPIVEQHSKVTDPKAFMEYVHDLKNAEGFVIRWADGHRVKIKAHEYIQIHKAKEAILQDRNIVSLIVENLLDDIKSHLPSEDKIAIEEFENKINAAIIRRMDVILQIFDGIGNSDRKSFALGLANDLDQFTKAAIFTCWDKRDANSVLSCIKNTILNNLSKTVKYEYIKSEWFPLVQYNSI